MEVVIILNINLSKRNSNADNSNKYYSKIIRIANKVDRIIFDNFNKNKKIEYILYIVKTRIYYIYCMILFYVFHYYENC